jgi:FkbM family methyltransferase
MSSGKNPVLKIASWAAHALPAPIKKIFYKIPFLASFLRHSLNQAAPSGITQVEIAGGTLAGMRMALDLHSEKDYWLGTYEPDLQAAAKHFIQPGMTVYDVGANIGYISLMAARLNGPDGKVFAFEALPANIQRLQQNRDLNQLAERIIIQQAAVVDASGKVTFLMHQSGAMGKAMGSAGRDEAYQQNLEVNGLALDDFVFGQKQLEPGLIKLDIEGGEGMALAGMARILKEIRPIFLIELHGEQAAGQVWEQLTASHYSLHQMRHGFPRINALKELDWKAYVVALPAS